MTIIDLNTGKVKPKKPVKLPKCKICNTDVNDEGMSGKIDILPISFCGVCKLAIVQMLIDNSRG
jgi:hypothetical protein